MPNPYRRAPTQSRPPVADELKTGARWDDLVLGALMLTLAGPRVVFALIDHETFGAETTVAAVALALGLLLLVARPRRC